MYKSMSVDNAMHQAHDILHFSLRPDPSHIGTYASKYNTSTSELKDTRLGLQTAVSSAICMELRKAALRAAILEGGGAWASLMA